MDWIPFSLVIYIAGLDLVSPSPDDSPTESHGGRQREGVRGGQRSINAGGEARGVPQDPCRVRALATDFLGLVPQEVEGQPRE